MSSAPPTFSSCGGLVTLGHLGAFEPQIYFREDGRTDGGFLGVRYPAGIRNMVNESVQCIPRIMDPHCTVHSKVHLRNSARCSPTIRTHVIPDSIAPCWQTPVDSRTTATPASTCSPAPPPRAGQGYCPRCRPPMHHVEITGINCWPFWVQLFW